MLARNFCVHLPPPRPQPCPRRRLASLSVATSRWKWTKEEDRRSYLENIGSDLGVYSLDDWYRISSKQVAERGAASLLHDYYAGSLAQALLKLFPHHNWLPWKFKGGVPAKFWTKRENQVAYMKWLGNELGFTKTEDWYKLRQEDLSKRHGDGLLQEYSRSPSKLVQAVFPDHEWLPWMFHMIPHGFWSEQTNRITFLKHAEKSLKIAQSSDWFKIEARSLINLGGRVLMAKWTLPELLAELYPEEEWHPWLFETTPPGFWNEVKNRRSYLEWLQKLLGYRRLSDSYRLTLADFERNCGAWLMHKFYKSSPMLALMDCFPEYKWIPWRFNSLPGKFWESSVMRQNYLAWLADKFSVRRYQDYYHCSAATFEENRGWGLLSEVKSHQEIFLREYPSYRWLPWAFSLVPKNFWANREFIWAYFDWLGARTSTKEFSDWATSIGYRLKTNGGMGLFTKYEGSPIRLLNYLYPSFFWRPYELANSPRNFWIKHPKATSDFFRYLERSLLITEPSDWYRISLEKLKSRGGGSLVSAYGGLEGLLTAFHPQVNWDSAQLAKKFKKASQRWLCAQLRELLDDKTIEIVEEYHGEILRYKNSSLSYLLLDIYVPKYRLALEYQGAQHYRDIMQFGIAQLYRSKDAEKKAVCKEEGITLVVIPYWWDEKIESLAATLHRVRPDIFPSDLGGVPIPEEPHS